MPAPRAALTRVSAQVLSADEYACWLQRHLEAEAAVDNREQLLFESAARLETNLHLLGNAPALSVAWTGVEVADWEGTRLQWVAALLTLRLVPEPQA